MAASEQAKALVRKAAAAALEISPSTIYRKRLSWEREGKVAGAA